MDWKIAAVIVFGIMAWFGVILAGVNADSNRTENRRKHQAECYEKTKREECWK